jgi:membrane protease YdiL (CAAX protease family)
VFVYGNANETFYQESRVRAGMNEGQTAIDISELFSDATYVDLVVCSAGLFVLIFWLARTSFGTKSLSDAPNRRNDMPIYIALMPVLMWIMTIIIMAQAKKIIFPDLPGWKNAFAENLIICLGGIPALAMIVFIAKVHFARGLKGLGLNPRTIGRDLVAAFLNLLTIMPIVLGLIIATTIAGKLIVGPQFEMPKHEELNEIINYSEIPLRVLIVISTILIVPFTEEMIFRGMLQTLFRSYLARPWPAIILASIIFIIFHENPQHWPALFALSMCLGYSYEKSGSLFRSILIHAMFNALSVISSLFQ